MRPVYSCTPCRSQKKRCLPTPQGDKCQLCDKKQVACDLPRFRSSPQSVNDRDTAQPHSILPRPFSASASGSSNHVALVGRPETEDIALDSAVYDDLIGLYFDMIHNKQQILFHRQTFFKDRRSGSLPDYLVLGIAALVARFSSHARLKGIAPHERASPYLNAALSRFWVRGVRISIYALQASILLSFVCFVEAMADESTLLAAQAIRMVQVLQLGTQSASTNAEREMKVRLYWQVFMMDTWDAVRGQIPRQLLQSPLIPLPLDEVLFEDLDPDQASFDELDCHEQRSSSLWSHVVALTESFAEVAHFVATSIQTPGPTVAMTDSKAVALKERLDTWPTRLPPRLLYTEVNLQQFNSCGRGRELAVLHLIYHHQTQLLYFCYLCRSLSRQSGDTEHTTVRQYAARCNEHAVACSNIMWRTNTTPGMECLWSPLNGHLLVVASAAHLYTLLCSQDTANATLARKLLEQNYAMLMQFQKYWPTVQISLRRLHILQRSCYTGDITRTFRMDVWMAEFLMSHDALVCDRFGHGPDGESNPDQREQDVSMTMSDALIQDLTSLCPGVTDQEFSVQSNLSSLLSFQ